MAVEFGAGADSGLDTAGGVAVQGDGRADAGFGQGRGFGCLFKIGGGISADEPPLAHGVLVDTLEEAVGGLPLHREQGALETFESVCGVADHIEVLFVVFDATRLVANQHSKSKNHGG